MGSGKGQSQTSQTSTYSPNPQAAGYITDALNRAQQTANLPFNIPQAPVAGFSQDQSRAFNSVNNAQGMALPYIQQGTNYFNQSAQPDVASFYNPMAANVTANLKDIFGQQNVQNTGNLVQSAGGVGADRIGVGQANMAKEQGLAAGQTYAGLYQQAVQQAQQQQNILQAAGYGYGALGGAAQNSVLQGAQAQLGTGGLQQQLQQAQLNSPYQQQIAQAAFPYQQSQYYASMVGALAPGLGGTTTGSGTSTPAQPSVWSQLLGAGMAGAGVYGGLNKAGSGSGYGSSPNTDAINNSMNTLNSDTGGAFYGPGFIRGGAIGYDGGGNVSSQPIDISSNPYIPKTQLTPIQPHIPQLQQQQPQSGGSGGGLGDIIKTGVDIGKMAMMFANRGGTVPHMAGGGTLEERFAPVQEAIADGTFDREGLNTQDNDFAGSPFTNERGLQASVPLPRARPGRMTASAAPPDSAMAFAGTPDASSDLPPQITKPNAYAPQDTPEGGGDAPGGGGAPSGGSTSPYQIPMTPGGQERQSSFANSPWAALMQAGLGIMGGTSPFAGVNIGQGGMQGLKTLQEQQKSAREDETTAQAAKRLEQEAKFHEDAYTRQKPPEFGWKVNKDGTVEPTKRGPNDPDYLSKVTEANRKERYGGIGSLVTKDGAVHPLVLEGGSGRVIDGVTGQPPVDTDKLAPKGAPKGATLADADAHAAARYAVATGDESSLRNATGVNAENKGLVQKYLNEEKTAQNVDDAEYARRKQEFGATGISKNAAARVRATREANLNLILKATTAAIPAALEESDKVERYTGIVPFDRLIQNGQLATNDPNLVTFGLANLQLAEHFARAMNPTGVMRESDRDKALHFLDTAFSNGTYKAAVMQVKKQIERERDATLEGKASSGLELGQEPKPTGAAAPSGNFTPPAGAVSRTDKNGKTWWFDPNTKQPIPGQT